MLSPEQIARLDEVSAIPPVYPYTVLNERRIQDLITGDMVDRIDMPPASIA